MKELYINAEIELVEFDAIEIITSSVIIDPEFGGEEDPLL